MRPILALEEIPVRVVDMRLLPGAPGKDRVGGHGPKLKVIAQHLAADLGECVKKCFGPV